MSRPSLYPLGLCRRAPLTRLGMPTRPTSLEVAGALGRPGILSAGNTHDSHGLKPKVTGLRTGHDPQKGWPYKPRKLHADKAYDIPEPCRWLRGKRIGVLKVTT